MTLEKGLQEEMPFRDLRPKAERAERDEPDINSKKKRMGDDKKMKMCNSSLCDRPSMII